MPKVKLSPKMVKRPITREWEGSTYFKYATRIAYQAQPSLARLFDAEDLVTEAHFKFLKLKQKYPYVNDRHFMGLFKTSLRRMLAFYRAQAARLSNEMLLVDFLAVTNSSQGDDVPLTRSGQQILDFSRDLYEAGEGNDPETALIRTQRTDPDAIRALLRDAPKEVKDAVGLMISTPADILNEAADAWKSRGKKKPFGTHMLCALLGINQRRAKRLWQNIVTHFELAYGDEG